MPLSSLIFLLMLHRLGRFYELGLIIPSQHDYPALIIRTSYCLIIRHVEILDSWMKSARPSEPFYLAAIKQPCALISARAQMYNTLTLYMTGEVICDMEAIALQRDDVLQSEHFTPLVWLCHVCACVRLCTSFSCSHGNRMHIRPHDSICMKPYYVSLS